MEGFKYDTKASVNIRLDKRRLLKTGKYPVKVEVYFMGQKKRYEAKISLTETEWEKMSAPKLKDEELKEKRVYIKNLEKKALDIVKDLGSQFTLDSFDILFLGSESKLVRNKQDVYAAFEIYVGKLKEEGRIGTEKSYEAASKSLRQFMSKLNFTDITVPFLEAYERDMLKQGKSVTTIGIYLRSLRTIVNIARSEKVINEEQYPFGLKSRKKYEIPRANNIKKALDESALSKILTCECVNDDEAWARDMWLFSFYCNGMNMADIFHLKYRNIKGEFLYFVRQKTIRTKKVQEPIEIYLSEPIREIIEKWGTFDKSADNYVFGVFNNRMTAEEIYRIRLNTIRSINHYMKNIGERLKIEVPTTTYVARHSWATTLLRKGISTAYISKGFGHASFSTTEQYLGGFTQDQKKSVADLLSNLANG